MSEVVRAQTMARIERTVGGAKPFNPEVRTCPKCMLSSVADDGTELEAFKLEFCIGTDGLSGQAALEQCPVGCEGQHLHVGCKRCGYIWVERCADYEAMDGTRDGHDTGGDRTLS